MAERFDLGNKLVGYAVESGFHIRVAGFGDVVGRSPRERFQCGFRASFRERAEHYDGHAAVELADLRNGFEPVHLGHLDIEQNYVRTQLSKLRQRQAAIAGRAYHFERGMAWRAGTPEARFYFPFIRNSPSFNRPVTLRK